LLLHRARPARPHGRRRLAARPPHRRGNHPVPLRGGPRHRRDQAPSIDPRRSSPLQLAVYPMGVPTLAGPGSMLTVMLRTDNSRISLLEWVHTMAAVVFVLAITYRLLRSAGVITRLIGSGGASILRPS